MNILNFVKIGLRCNLCQIIHTIGESDSHKKTCSHQRAFNSQQRGGHIGSQKVPNAKSKMQKSGGLQKTIGKKGALMKQDQIILDYGR